MAEGDDSSFLDVPIGDAEVERSIEGYLRKRFPQLENDYRRGWESFKKLKRSGEFDPASFAVVEAAASSRYAALWDPGTNWLRHLSDEFPAQVAEAVGRMSSSLKAYVRFSSLCVLSLRLPRPLVVRVVRRLLDDRSAQVRTKAVEQASIMDLREVIQDIQARRGIERSELVRRSIDFHVPLLKHGYFLEDNGNHLTLVVKGPAGISSGVVTKEEMDQWGLEEIAERRRKDRLSKPVRLRFIV